MALYPEIAKALLTMTPPDYPVWNSLLDKSIKIERVISIGCDYCKYLLFSIKRIDTKYITLFHVI
jgi:hypothetical protein